MRAVVTMAVAAVLAGTAACGDTSPAEETPPEVTGLITAVGRDDRGAIRTFTIDQDGTRYRIHIDPGHDYGFDLEHLEEHRMDRLPVRVTVEDRGETPVAVEILDA